MRAEHGLTARPRFAGLKSYVPAWIIRRCRRAPELRKFSGSREFLDQSAQIVRDLLADAEAGNHAVSLGFALTWSIFLISLGEDLEAAERLIAQLEDHAYKHELASYGACCLGFQGLLSAKRGDFVTGERLLRDCLIGLRRSRYEVAYVRYLTGLAEVLTGAGRPNDGLAVANEAQEYAERNDALWLMPEILRVKGEVLLAVDRANAAAAEEHFGRSLDLARRQGALSWELRSAMSLGQLYQAQSRSGAAQALLSSVYAKFTEGFETRELQRAKQLLEQWK